MSKISKVKIDIYKKTRGNYTRFLEVCCNNCGSLICVYQKDGPGRLKRMYLDRIIYPRKLVGLERMKLKEIDNLSCFKCKRWVAIPYIYSTENRLAFRIFEGELDKKIINMEVLQKYEL